MSRIGNAIKTLLRAAVREELTAQRTVLQRDVRELCGEMEDVLESFSAVMRREAARRARDIAADAKRRASEGDGEAGAAEGAGVHAPASPEDEKNELRRRFIAGRRNTPAVELALNAVNATHEASSA